MTEEDKEIDANEFLNNCDEEEFFKLRSKIEKNRKTTPIALCNVCFQPVVLRANTHRTTFFAHVKDSEDCPIKTTSHLTLEEICAMKYNGQKEGLLHRENKEIISQLLIRDCHFDNEVRVEKTFREKHPVGIAKRWRRPDISVVFTSNQREVVFELQVSTTFLDVIINREEFYKQNDAYITWIFLSADHDKFTTLDIAYANKANFFVFNQETLHESENRNSLVLKCYYRQPFMNDNLMVDYRWTSEIVDFSMLSFDDENKKVFYVDTDKLKADVLAQIQDEKIKIQEANRKEREAKYLKEAQAKAEKERLDKLNRSYSHFPTPKNYKEKGHRTSSLPIHSVTTNRKSYGNVVICKKCNHIGKPRQMGRLTVCDKCRHEII